jgi:hypothetical protein
MFPQFEMFMAAVATPFRMIYGNHGIECNLPENSTDRYAEGYKFTGFAPYIFIGGYLLIAVMLFIWKMLRGQRSTNLKSFVIGSMVLLFTFIYPGVVNHTISIFNCVEVSEGRRQLVNNMAIECGSSQHSELITGSAIFNLIAIVISKVSHSSHSVSSIDV